MGHVPVSHKSGGDQRGVCAFTEGTESWEGMVNKESVCILLAELLLGKKRRRSFFLLILCCHDCMRASPSGLLIILSFLFLCFSNLFIFDRVGSSLLSVGSLVVMHQLSCS